MSSVFDVAVVGLGAMGAAAAHHLARRGRRVLGIERFGLPHQMGSSHGYTRLLRVAYAEGAAYVPLVRRARDLWLDLGREIGRPLFETTGSLDIGRLDGDQVPSALASSKANGLDHELLDAAEIMRRHPAWRLPSDLVGLHQPEGGFVRSEAAILAHATLAAADGAALMTNTRVLAVEETGAGTARIVTDAGTFEAGQVVIAAGAWIGALVPALARHLDPRRIPIGWFATARPELFAAERFPIWTLEVEEGGFYGAPIDGHPGVKIGGPSSAKHPEWSVDPETAPRGPLPGDEAGIRSALSRYLPDGDGAALLVQGCLVTYTADEHFVIDRVPGFPAALVLSCCSGHGFKFASVVGEIAADLVTTDATRHAIDRFALARLARAA